jgi:phosphoribosylanthranilate isomerase
LLHREPRRAVARLGQPRVAVKQPDGTGRTHDWAVSREIVQRAGVPVWLAGGLQAGNVAEAIATVRPHGLDLCNGVHSEGRLDASKLADFMAAVRR